MATIRLEIVSAERMVYSDDVDIVIAPGVEGQLGILPHHTPLLTTLQSGELRARKGGDEVVMAISGGFMEVLSNKVVILADTAERAEEIDEARAEAARQRALRTVAEKKGTEEFLVAVAALRRSQVRLKVARRRERRQPPQGR